MQHVYSLGILAFFFGTISCGPAKNSVDSSPTARSENSVRTVCTSTALTTLKLYLAGNVERSDLLEYVPGQAKHITRWVDVTPSKATDERWSAAILSVRTPNFAYADYLFVGIQLDPKHPLAKNGVYVAGGDILSKITNLKQVPTAFFSAGPVSSLQKKLGGEKALACLATATWPWESQHLLPFTF